MVKNDKDYAVILDLSSENAVGVVRSLALEKIPVAGFHIEGKYPHAFYSKNLDIKKILKDKDSFIEHLVKFGESQNNKGIIFCTSDTYLAIAQEFSEVLSKYFIVPNSRTEDVRNIIDKRNILSYAKKSGFEVPIHSALSDEAVSNFDFPVILKPTHSIGRSKSDMFVLNGKKEIKEKRNYLLDKYGDMEVEQFIPGSFDNQIEVHFYKSNSGKTYIGGMLRYGVNYKEDGLVTLLSSVDKSDWFEDLLEPTENFSNLIDFNGAVDLNLKISSEDNKKYFYEANLRTSANLFLDTLFGLNLPAIMYLDQNNKKYDHLLNKPYQLNKFWVSDRLIDVSLEQGLVTKEEVEFMLNNGVRSIYDSADSSMFTEAEKSGNLLLKIKK